MCELSLVSLMPKKKNEKHSEILGRAAPEKSTMWFSTLVIFSESHAQGQAGRGFSCVKFLMREV